HGSARLGFTNFGGRKPGLRRSETRRAVEEALHARPARTRIEADDGRRAGDRANDGRFSAREADLVGRGRGHLDAGGRAGGLPVDGRPEAARVLDVEPRLPGRDGATPFVGRPARGILRRVALDQVDGEADGEGADETPDQELGARKARWIDAARRPHHLSFTAGRDLRADLDELAREADFFVRV